MPAAGTLTGITSPSPSRVFNYLLGGKDNFAADRDAAEALETASGRPGTLRQLARRDRLYLARAVSWCVHQGVRQVLDLGAGLPVPEPYQDVHEIAAKARTGARVCYVDSDPVAVRHGGLAMTGDGVAYVEANLRDVEKVLEAASTVIDPGKPVVIVAAMVSYFLPASEFGEAVENYVTAAAKRSYLVVTAPLFPPGPAWGNMRDAYAGAAPLFGHSRQDIESFFAGTQMIGSGVEFARDTRPEPLTPGGACVLGGIGRKP